MAAPFDHNQLCDIFSHCSLQDLLVAAKICPKFKRAVMHILQDDYEAYQLEWDEFYSFDEVREAFVYVGPIMNDLIIYSNSDIQWDINMSHVYQIIEMCPTLEKLELVDELRMAPVEGIQPPDLKQLESISFLYNCDENLISELLSVCSDELKSLVIYDTQVSGDCFMHLPNAVQEMELYRVFEDNDNFYKLIEYFKRNTSLTRLNLCEDIDVDLIQLCVNLPGLQKLILHCTYIMHFEWLATLTKLTKLEIAVKSEFFEEYPNTLSSSSRIQQLKTLRLDIHVDVTREMAESFKHFKYLEKLSIAVHPPAFLDPNTHNHDRVLPYLEAHDQLAKVTLSGVPFDFELVCKHLRKVTELSTYVRCSDFQPLLALRQLKHLENLSITIMERSYADNAVCDYQPDSEPIDSAGVNQLINAVINSQKIHTLTIKKHSPTELYTQTLEALRSATALKTIHLEGVLTPMELLKLLRNAPNLRTIFQKYIQKYTDSEMEELKRLPAAQAIVDNLEGIERHKRNTEARTNS